MSQEVPRSAAIRPTSIQSSLNFTPLSLTRVQSDPADVTTSRVGSHSAEFNADEPTAAKKKGRGPAKKRKKEFEWQRPGLKGGIICGWCFDGGEKPDNKTFTETGCFSKDLEVVLHCTYLSGSL